MYMYFFFLIIHVFKFCDLTNPKSDQSDSMEDSRRMYMYLDNTKGDCGYHMYKRLEPKLSKVWSLMNLMGFGTDMVITN